MAEQNLTVFQRLTKVFGYPGQVRPEQTPSFNFSKDELLKTDSKEEYEKAKEMFYIIDDEKINIKVNTKYSDEDFKRNEYKIKNYKEWYMDQESEFKSGIEKLEILGASFVNIQEYVS